MTRLTDEMLMAYADGALPEAEAAQVAAALEHDAEARAIVAEFRRTAELSRAAFTDVMTEPVPEQLVRTILGAEARSANVVDLAQARKPRPSPWRTVLPLAASVLLVLGVAATLFLQQLATEHAIALGTVPKASPLAEVLETKPSGTPVTLARRATEGADRLMVVATFRDRKARICREIEALDQAMQPQLAGVACRDPANGDWTVEGTARIAASSPPSTPGYVPSGSDEKDALDGLLALLGASQTLSPDEEQNLMRQGWR